MDVMESYKAGIADSLMLQKLQRNAERKGLQPWSQEWRSYVFGTFKREKQRSEAKAKKNLAQSARRD